MGSKALQQARNWQPAKQPKALLSTEKHESSTMENPEYAEGLLSGSEAGHPSTIGSGLVVESPEEGGDAVIHYYNDELHPDHHKNHLHKMNIMHPGYFPPSPGPVYTPAPPGALAELRKSF